MGSSPGQVVVGDFNGDGLPDLAVAQFWSTAYFYTGRGDGTFSAPVPIVAQQFLASGFLASADFDGDGYPDLANPDQNNGGKVFVLLSQPTETATATVSGVTPSGPGPHQVEAVYAGDPRHLTSTSGTTGLLVQVATPVLSLGTGAYNSVQTLSITDATPNATIYYQLQGDSSIGPTVYTGPITFPNGGGVYVLAYAVENGYEQSQEIAATYTLNYPLAPAPLLSLAAGVYITPQTVTITDAAPGTKIHYTTDGSYPSSQSLVYTGPITIAASETLVAAAVGNGLRFGRATSAQYLIGSASAPFIYSIAGTGTASFSGDGGPATNAGLNYPQAVTVDPAGDVYIADAGNNVVRRIDATTGVITTVAGTGVSGDAGDGGAAVSAQLDGPVSLALDHLGNMYIGESGNDAIREVSASTGTISTLANSVEANGTGAVAFRLSPQGMVFDASNNLYVVANDGQIVRVAAADGTITSLLPPGTESYSLTGLALDAAGNLYFADSVLALVRKLNLSTGVLSTVAGTTNPAANPGDGGQATSTRITTPTSTAVDPAGNLYFTDEFQNAVRKVSASTGIISTVAGTGLNGNCDDYSGDGGPARGAGLCFPQGLALDGAGNLYVADTSHERIRKILSASPLAAPTAAPTFSLPSGTYPGAQTLTISEGTPGAAIYVTVGEASATTLAGGYSGPIAITGSATVHAIAVAPGSLPSTVTAATYSIGAPPSAIISTVAGNGIYTSTPPSGPATGSSLGAPNALAKDAAGNLYFSEQNASMIWKLSTQTGQITAYAGNGTPGYSGDGGPASSAQLSSPSGLAVDGSGNLYIADEGNYTVRKIDAVTGIITTVAGTGSLDHNGGNGPALSTRLFSPRSVTFDALGNLYFGDGPYVRMVNASTGMMTTVAGSPAGPTDSGDGGPATDANLGIVKAIALDPGGNLYVASLGGRVRKVTSATGLISTVAGNGDAGTGGDGGPATRAEIYPEGLVINPAGDLLIADLGGEIRQVAAGTGLITRIAGIGYPGYTGDGGAATMAEIHNPEALCLDPSGNLYFSDIYDSVIREVSPANGLTAAPTFSPVGGTYTGTQTVAIVDSTPAATIFYTTDGTAPTAASTPYTGLVTVSSTATLQAIATAPGFAPGAVARATYTITTPVGPPVTITPAADSVLSSQTFTVTVRVGSSGQPVPSGTVTLSSGGYSAQLALSAGSATFTVAPGALSAGTDTLTAVYTPDSASASAYAPATQTTLLTITEAVAAAPTFSPAGGTFPKAQTISITESTAGATVHYTLDGSAPTSASPSYAGPLALAGSATLKAIAIAPGYASSTIVSAAYTISIPVAPAVLVTPAVASLLSTQPLVVQVTVGGGQGKAVATGTITLRSGTFSAQQTLSSGATSFTVPAGALMAGTDTLTATYAPDAASAAVYTSAAQSTTIAVTAIGTAPVSLSATPASQTITDQQTASLVVALAGGSGQPAPTGSLTLSTGTLRLVQPVNSGSGSFTLQGSALGAGASTLAISYSGDGVYAPTMTGASVTVAAFLPKPVPPLTITAGASGSAPVTFAASSFFSGTLSLACSLASSPAGAQYPPSCSLSPAQITVAAGGSATSTLAVQTTSTAVTASRAAHAGPSIWVDGGVSFCAGLLCLWVPQRRRRHWPLLAVLLAMITGALLGCGSGAPPAAPPTSRTEKTTSGTYTFVLTATDTANANLQSSTTVSVAVP